MALPVITSITFDKGSYVSGDLITVTVNYQQGTSDVTQTLTGTATDTTTGQTGSLVVSFTVTAKDITDISVSDTGGRTWTRILKDDSKAVFQAVA